jgi:hypothetical protein
MTNIKLLVEELLSEAIVRVRGLIDDVSKDPIKTTSELQAALKKTPKLGFFASWVKADKRALNDWIQPEWLNVEKREKLHVIYEDGAGNAIFFSEVTHTVWDFDHEENHLVDLKRTFEQYRSSYLGEEPEKKGFFDFLK